MSAILKTVGVSDNLNSFRSILIDSNRFPVLRIFNKTILNLFNRITVFFIERHRLVKQVFIVGSAAGKDFCPFLSDLDLFIILRDCPAGEKLKTLENFVKYYHIVAKINPFIADFSQPIIFEDDVESYHRFWYFYHDISHGRALNNAKFLTKFPHGKTNFLIMANWDRALNWYIPQCRFFYNKKLPLYSRHHNIPSKVAFFSNRVQTFCALPGETFSCQDFVNLTSSEYSGQNKKTSENYKKSYATQVDDLIRSFLWIQQSATSIKKRLSPLDGITYEDPPYIQNNETLYHSLPTLLDLKDIPVVLSLGNMLFIFISTKIDEKRLRQCFMAIETVLKRLPASEIRIFPVNVLPFFYRFYQTVIVHCDSEEYLKPDTSYLKYLILVRSVFAQGSLMNTLSRRPDASKQLSILAMDFLRIKLTLEARRFALQPDTLLKIVEENRKYFSPKLEDIADKLLENSAEDNFLDKNTLYDMTDRLREDNFRIIQSCI